MADGNLVRLGGIFGLLSVVIMIPAYLVGSPDVPGSRSKRAPTSKPGWARSSSPTVCFRFSTSSSSSCSSGCCTGCSEVPKRVIGEQQQEEE